MSQSCCNRIFRGEAWACFLLRMWIGVRLLLAGIVKFLDKDQEGNWQFSDQNAANSMDNVVAPMKEFSAIPTHMIDTYAKFLPWALIVIGCWVIAGLFTRISLVVAGLTILSLSFGLLMLPDEQEGTMRGIEMIVIALALITARYNILAIDNLIQLALGGDRGEDEEEDRPRRQKD